MKSSGSANRVAVVTGGSGGLGREIAAHLCREAWHVAAVYHTAESVASGLQDAFGDLILPCRANVTEKEDMERVATDVVTAWGHIDALIACAGITRDGLIVRQGVEDWESVMEVNLKGLFHAVRAVAPRMSEGGHIITISSYSGLKGRAGQAAYSASKASLLGLTVSLAREMAPLNIRVNAVLPGYMETPMGAASPAAMTVAKRESLLGCLSDPAEVARFIAWLVGTERITGQVFTLDSRIA